MKTTHRFRPLAIALSVATPLLYVAAVHSAPPPATAAEQDAPASRNVRGATNDAAITAKVKTALLRDPQVAGLKIDVDTRGGIVTLSGKVNSSDESQRAALLAMAVEGVVDVVNRLETQGG